MAWEFSATSETTDDYSCGHRGGSKGWWRDRNTQCIQHLLPTTSPYMWASCTSGISNVIGILDEASVSFSGFKGGPAYFRNSESTGYHGHVPPLKIMLTNSVQLDIILESTVYEYLSLTKIVKNGRIISR